MSFLSSNTSAGWVSLCPFLEDGVETYDLEGTVWSVEDLRVLGRWLWQHGSQRIGKGICSSG